MAKFRNTIYMLSVKEWNLDSVLQRLFWKPFKAIGNGIHFIFGKKGTLLFFTIMLGAVVTLRLADQLPPGVLKELPLVFSFIGMLVILNAFSEKGSALIAWGNVIMGQLFITTAVLLLSENFGSKQALIYLGGSAVCAAIGAFCLLMIRKIDNHITLDIFHGYSYEQPRVGLVFLICCLGVAGLPFTPTFIGIDLLFSNIHPDDLPVVVFTAISFIFMELSILRIYSRIFLGQHKKASHAMAYRSS